MKLTSFLCLGLLLLAGRSTTAASLSLNSNWLLQDAVKVKDSGSQISLPDYHPRYWHKATVPGTVLTSLVNDGIYPEPLYGLNNLKISDDLCRTTYWYRRTFTIPPDEVGKQLWLRFNGINYIADVWLNGKRVGTIKGAFVRGLFNITPYIIHHSINVLAVHVLPPPNPGKAHQKTQASGTGYNGGVLAEDGPTFLCSIGWDWIPTIRDRDTGLWQSVSLKFTGPVTIHYPNVVSKLPLPSTSSASLTVQAILRNSSSVAQSGVLVGTFGTSIFRYHTVIAPRQNLTVNLSPANTPALYVLHPHLWWPNGYGNQYLYHLHLKFITGKGVSDSTDTQFGIRTISYFVAGSNNLTLSVNGVPVLVKGGDWGMDEAMKRISYARLNAQIRMHKEANFTLIRNWVGQSTSQEFYNLCDKYGILVWDEFFQPNPADGPNPLNDKLYLANVRGKILRFRSHPCIAIWCARNEGDPPPAIGKGIKALLAKWDPTRLYQPSSTSGHGVSSGGPYCWQPPDNFYRVDAPFKTEIGSVSVPTLEAIHAMMPSRDWGTINNDWAEHDFCAGAQGGDWYPKVMAQRYGAISSLADFTRKAQLMNYEAFRAMYEGREVQLFHPVTGIITWMSNPAQPSFVWQLYSHDLEPNSSLFAVRKACEPVHIMMNQTDGHIVVINNKPWPLKGLNALVNVYNLNSSMAYHHTYPVNIEQSCATDIGAISFPETLSEVNFVQLTLLDAQGHAISDNFYWHRIPAAPDNYQDLNKLPTAVLTAHVIHHLVGSNCFVRVVLTNSSHTVALMTHLQLREGTTGHRVLPVFYSSNYISLVPGEQKTVTIEAAKSDLHGHKPLVVVDGWNVSVKQADGIETNKEAFVLDIPTVDHTKKPILMSGSIRINCGSSRSGSDGYFTFGHKSGSKSFVGDCDYQGGGVDSVGTLVNTGTKHAAPEYVYQSERWGSFTYSIPEQIGHSFLVRLHFAETTWNHPGARVFKVEINGKTVLSNFDIFAEAGGEGIAVVREFSDVMPNAGGDIVIKFIPGNADQPEVRGIEVLPEKR